MNSAGVMIDGDKILKNTNSTTLLGLDIDSKLCFNEHIDKICKKLSKRIGILRKVRSYLPLKQRELYYNAIIHPIFNNANVIWTACNKDSLIKQSRY